MTPDGSNAKGTREKLLEVAEREFAARGFPGAHLQAIAEQIGVQKTALYYYFESKEALYVAVLRNMLEDFDRTVAAALDGPGDHLERLDRLLSDVNRLLADKPNYAQILVRILVDRVKLEGAPLRPLTEQLVGRQLVFYREGVDAGVFAKLSPRHIYMSVLGASVFHYATGSFAETVLGVDDLFSDSAVAWRGEQIRKLILKGALAREDG